MNYILWISAWIKTFLLGKKYKKNKQTKKAKKKFNYGVNEGGSHQIVVN